MPGAAARPLPPKTARGPSSKPSLRERFNALRKLPPFLRLIWATSRSLR